MHSIYQFKITLVGSRPPIWRRVLVPAHFTLKELHEVIQNTFDWEQSHLYSFEHLGKRYDDENPKSISKKLSELNIKEKSQLEYTYDFGDNWEHTVLLEKIITQEKEKIYPCCIAGNMAAPPEDAGGVWGYEHKRAILEDKNHPEYEALLEWMGEDFDADAFDQEAINERLRNLSSAKA